MSLVNTECSNNNGGCSHLCVLSSGGTYSCLCPDNLRLDHDKRTCVSRSKLEFMKYIIISFIILR